MTIIYPLFLPRTPGPIEANNWKEVSDELADGTQITGHHYVPQEAESQHFASLQEAARDKLAGTNMREAINLVLEDPSRSSPDFAAKAVQWARNATDTPKSEDADEAWMREQAIVAAAMITMRDGDAELRTQHAEWARTVFAQALQTEEDPVHRVRSGLRFNPIAITFVGMIHSLKDNPTTWDFRALLEAAASHNPAAAHGFGVVFTTLDSIDGRLPRAIQRCAFAASIRPSREREFPEDEVTARNERHQRRIQATVGAELEWLADERPEPDWPAFPPKTAQVRRGNRKIG